MVDDNVQQLIDTLAEMRAVISEAHGARKDLERTLREAREFLKTEVETEVQKRINEAVARNVDALGEATTQAMEACTAKVLAEFDKLFSQLMGMTKQHQRRGDLSLPDMVEILSEGEPSPFGPIRRERN